MNDCEPVVFHEQYMKSDMNVWIKTFFKPCPEIMWTTLQGVFLSCSDWGCDHNWSIEGWIIPRGETDSVRTLSIVSCVHTPTFSLSTVWSSMWLVCSHGTLRWQLKSLCQTTRTGSLTVSLTPSLNPKRTLTKFLRQVTRRVSFIYIYIYIIFNIFFIFYLQFFLYIWSSEPVQTDSKRSSLRPVFFGKTFLFSMFID